ncbi:MAG: RyR domain-containing protein [Bacteroidia bacterium]|nr:RyR domain-containing protein [Bacteroidia bacterium]
MSEDFTKRDILKWIEVIYKPGNKVIQEITSNWSEYKKIFIDQVAENLYTDIQRTQHLFSSPYTFGKEFIKIREDEKTFWYEFAFDIPKKLRSLNLYIRPYKDFCITCLIPYNEIEILARTDYNSFCQKQISSDDLKRKNEPVKIAFGDLPEERKRFYIELNLLIPVALKKIGYEIIRIEEITEINEKMVLRFARAIHSRYLHEIRKRDPGSKKISYMSWIHSPGDARNKNLGDFDDLPEEIKHSNLDNAYHIPAKLLSIGYKVRQTGKGFKPASLHLTEDEVETMARVEHIRWCWDKILHGWIYGKVKDDRKKTHPSIIPYEDLSESEKEKDRELVRLIPALLQDIDYDVFHVNPERISKLPYAIKPQSSIHRILDETRKMNAHIRRLVSLSPDVEDMVEVRNRKIEEAVKEIESSYNYALHIQESFLPDNLFVRECFPESFILFKPKDIVSGDFYFFSKQDHRLIFAAADCTGHGIPGALLSTIGYGILDEAVNELKLKDPPEILKHLYSKMHKFLKMDTEETSISDDMDIALCTLDSQDNILIYSGIGNPLYHVTAGKLDEYRAGNLRKKDEGRDEQKYVSERIHLQHGDAIYLCSDGYADQFGGRDHKKYQSARLKSFILSIQENPMPEQGDRLYEEIEKWRESNNEDQTDDILVIGIRV